MKHNTHIYIAAKAIELIRQSVDNMIDGNGNYLRGAKKTKERNQAKKLQTLMLHYSHMIVEGAWAPDDVLKDNDPFHIFKLFTDEEFPGHTLTDKPKFESEGVTYYKFGGGLPYRVDHIVQDIINMYKLRNWNDRYTMKQILYKYLLISHYIADAHVPMHCDLRDDPPSSTGRNQPSRRAGGGKPAGKYMKRSEHNKLETVWDDAVTPVALDEKMFPQNWLKEKKKPKVLSDQVIFRLENVKKNGCVKVPIINKGGLMDFMVDVCITSKKRGQILFPLDDPQNRDETKLPEITRDIFADCIGNLIAVWRYAWAYS